MAVAGILLFAGFIHRTYPLKLLALAGLLVSAAVIAYSLRGQRYSRAFALDRYTRKTLLYSLAGLILGGVLALLTRRSFDLSFFPVRISGVALVAPLVGAAEELIFRGYIQGHVRPVGKIFAIVYASSVHTCYKLLVILSLSLPLQFDFFFLIFWTFIGGLIFGALRELSDSSLPPLLAHALFDVVLYGGMVASPAWVWS